MPPRILFVSHTADWSGPTNSLLHLLDYLREEFEVAVLLPGQGAFADMLRARAIPTHSLPSLRRSAIPAMVRLIRDGGFDLVYGNNTSSSSEKALAAAKITRRPFVCHIRGMAWRRGWRQLAFLRFADATVAVSLAAARATSRFTGPPGPDVVHNGITLSPNPPDRAAARRFLHEGFGFSAEAVVAIGVANLCARKGQEHAVRAFAEVAKRLPASRMLLVGERDPEYAAGVERLIKELRLDEHVRLAGFRRDVDLLLRGADVFVHTALADPHPRAVLEAMAAGLPVVAFDVDGVSETVVEGETGHLVPPAETGALANRMLELMLDEAGRHDQGRAGHERVQEHFSAERTARKVASIIRGTLRGQELADGSYPRPA